VTAVADAEKYRVRYRKVGTTEWTVKTQINPFRTLTGLIPNSTYQYQFRVKCPNKWSGFNASKTFKTLSDTSTGTGCNGTEVRVRLKLDDYGTETTYEIVKLNGTVMAQGGPYQDGNAGQVKNNYHCLPNGCYTLYLDDAFGDGICCEYGNGNLKLLDESNDLIDKSNGNFGFYDYIDFCVANGSGNREGRRTDTKATNIEMKNIN